MKVIIEHPVYGHITYDSGPKKVAVEKGNLAERLTWVMTHLDQYGEKGGYHPNNFLRACELLGVCGGELDVSVKTEGEANLPPGAVYSP